MSDLLRGVSQRMPQCREWGGGGGVGGQPTPLGILIGHHWREDFTCKLGFFPPFPFRELQSL